MILVILCGMQIIIAQDDDCSKGLPEKLAPIVAACQDAHEYTHILAAANAFGKNLLPRVASTLDVQPISVREISPGHWDRGARRTIYDSFVCIATKGCIGNYICRHLCATHLCRKRSVDSAGPL